MTNKNHYLVIALFCLGIILLEVIVFTSILTHPYMVFLLLSLAGVAIYNLIQYFRPTPSPTNLVSSLKPAKVGGYLVLFNQPDLNGQIITPENFDYTLLERMKAEGRIDYQVDVKGIQVSFYL